MKPKHFPCQDSCFLFQPTASVWLTALHHFHPLYLPTASKAERDEWGWLEDPDVDGRRATAWNKSTSLPKKSCRLKKGLAAVGRGGCTAAVAGEEPSRHVSHHARTTPGSREAAIVTFHCEARSQHGGVSPQRLLPVFITMEACYCRVIISWKLPPPQQTKTMHLFVASVC